MRKKNTDLRPKHIMQSQSRKQPNLRASLAIYEYHLSFTSIFIEIYEYPKENRLSIYEYPSRFKRRQYYKNGFVF